MNQNQQDGQSTQGSVIATDTQEEITINHIQSNEEVEEESGEIAVDIYQAEKEIKVIAPGVIRKNLSIRINDNVLIISGVRYSPSLSGGKYIVKECFWGKFSRMIVLPSKVDISHVKATFKDEVLVITIPVIFEPKEKIVTIDEE